MASCAGRHRSGPLHHLGPVAQRAALRPQAPATPARCHQPAHGGAGSLHETDGARGITHFVEHMGFNGTRRFKGETLGATLEKQGIRFGPDLTAFTWPSHTIYNLDLPTSDAAKLDLGLTVLREWASKIRFSRKQFKR
ncbi:MAG: insulinase family protein [Candidatus Synoicihabitans palmerolidicus]|nr:insulinase family protein [Candidatus Synoicihabitans palmerolidicus]